MRAAAALLGALGAVPAIIFIHDMAKPARKRLPPARRTSLPLYTSLIVAAAIVCYSNSLSGPFVFDDRTAIVENTSLRSFDSVLRQPSNSPLAGRPIVGLSFALNHRVGGLEVFGYHVANVAIHAWTALLLFGVVRRTLLMPPLRDRFGGHAGDLALAITLLWTVHPLNTEAVDYLTQRTELLMALMFMLTLYASVRGLQGSKVPGGQGSKVQDFSGWWQGVAIVACALGMACKESMVVAPILIVLYDATFAFNGMREAVRNRSGLYVGLAMSWAILVYLNLPGPRSGSAGFAAGVGPWTYLLNQAVMIVQYLRLAFWPTHLVINYGFPESLTLTEVLPKAVAVAALITLCLVALLRWPRLGFLGAWMFLTLAPTSSIIPIATEVGAERRMYLPLMALMALLVLALHRLFSASRLASPVLGRAVLFVAVVALSAATLARNREYGSALTLAQATLARWPSAVAHGLVGTELAALGRDEQALPELRVAAPIDPRARYNLGITLFNLKDYDGAIRELEALAREHPMREEVPRARRAIGNAYAVQRRWPEAVQQYRLVLSMEPSDATTRRLLVDTLINHGTALGSNGHHAEAIAAFRQVLELDPSNQVARHDLATALLDSGDAVGALREAQLTVDGSGGDAASYDLIGRALALLGRYDEAVEQLQKALRSSPNDRGIQDDLRQVLAVRSGPKPRGTTPK